MGGLPGHIDSRLKEIELIVNKDESAATPSAFRVGIDLGTADIVLLVVDAQGWPLAAFLEWAEVVRDGVVLDYWGAIEVVKRLLQRAEKKLNINIKSAVTSYPPGTDPRTSKNVLIAAGLSVERIVDEPSSVAHLLNIQNGAVVDIGGGTTGVAVVQDGIISYSADEPTGGRHITLTIAGNRKLEYQEAEKLKLDESQADKLRPIISPVYQKMSDIVLTHIADKKVEQLYLSGGSCCFPGVEEIFKDEIEGVEIILPYNPLYLTPLAIASYSKE